MGAAGAAPAKASVNYAGTRIEVTVGESRIAFEKKADLWTVAKP